MRKQILSLGMVFCLMLTLLPGTVRAAEAASGECGAEGGNATWTWDGAGTLTVSGTGAMIDYGFSDDHFPPWYPNEEITRIVIANGITHIGDYSFRESNISDIEIPDTVQSIGENAFADSGLSGVTIPGTVKDIGYRAFVDCRNLTEVEIQEGVEHIGPLAFYGCLIETVTLPAGVGFVGAGAFGSCNNLTAITVEGGGLGGYLGRDGILFLEEQDGQLLLMQYPAGRTSSSYDIPLTVARIEDDAFSGCNHLTSVSIPGNVKGVGDNAFEGCMNLENVSIAEGVEYLEFGVFVGCSNLREISIPQSLTEIPVSTFSGCSALADVNYAGTKAQWSAMTVGDGNDPLKSATIHCSDGDIAPENTEPSYTYGINSYFGVLDEETGYYAVDDIQEWSFAIDAPAGEFTGLYIDGERLTPGPGLDTDFEMESLNDGSTVFKKIDIHRLSTGVHTIAAEFLSGVGDQAVTHRAAQPFAIWPRNYATLPGGIVGVPYTYEFQDSWTIHELFDSDEVIRLPDGLTLNETTGVISGTPTKAGTWYFYVDFHSQGVGSGASPFKITVKDPSQVNYPALPEGVLGTPYHYDLEWSLENLSVLVEFQTGPRGLEIGYDESRTMYYIEGTPEESGTFVIELVGLGDRPNNLGDAWAYHNYVLTVREPEAVKFPDGVKYVPYYEEIPAFTHGEEDHYRFEYELQTGSVLPSGLSLDRESGIVSGVPLASGTWPLAFSVSVYDRESGALVEEAGSEPYSLTVQSNTDAAVQRPNDYDIIDPVGRPDSGRPGHFYKNAYTEEDLIIDGPYQEFTRLLIDGVEQRKDVDYTVREGSTVITIRSQTFQRVGEGTHTIAAEFRAGGAPDGTLKRVAQNYTLTLPRPSGGGSSGGGSRPTGSTQKPESPKPAQKPKLPFTDVSPSDWFYEDAVWAYENGVMVGVSDSLFAPRREVSQATIVTVLARLAKVDLTRFRDETEPGIQTGRSFTQAAVWAKRAGLLPESPFTGDETTNRNQMAVMLAKYLTSMGKDTSLPDQPVVFADAEEMTREGNDAFQVLYQYGIFKGVGGQRMNPAGSTTRAHFVALVHRVYETAIAQS